MRDLKNLLMYENLLQEAQNELVEEAVEKGEIALGYTCSYIPEVLLNLDGCFSVRLRAPRSSSPDVATYYLTNRNCPYSRCLLERAIEGGYNFLGALFGSETCAAMERAQEHFKLLHPIQNDKFFLTILDAPYKDDRTGEDFYESQLRIKVLEPLRAHYGIDVSDDAIRRAIERHNELCRVITEIGEFRKLPNPPITGYEFHVINLVSQVCPKDLILDSLKETLEELKTREPDPEPTWRARILVAGSEIDDPEFTKLLELCGGLVVADRYCFGSFPGREQIEIRAGETALRAVARHHLDFNDCPRFMNTDKINRRHQRIRDLAKEYKADGILYESMKFCEYWSYEKILASHVLSEEMGIPCYTIEKEYTVASSGQLRTRFQAFVESLEYKKLDKGGHGV